MEIILVAQVAVENQVTIIDKGTAGVKPVSKKAKLKKDNLNRAKKR